MSLNNINQITSVIYGGRKKWNLSGDSYYICACKIPFHFLLIISKSHLQFYFVNFSMQLVKSIIMWPFGLATLYTTLSRPRSRSILSPYTYEEERREYRPQKQFRTDKLIIYRSILKKNLSMICDGILIMTNKFIVTKKKVAPLEFVMNYEEFLVTQFFAIH